MFKIFLCRRWWCAGIFVWLCNNWNEWRIKWQRFSQMWIVETDIHCGNVNKPFFSLRLIIYLNKIFNIEKNKLKKNTKCLCCLAHLIIFILYKMHVCFVRRYCFCLQPTAYRIHQMITNDEEMSFKTEKCGKKRLRYVCQKFWHRKVKISHVELKWLI